MVNSSVEPNSTLNFFIGSGSDPLVKQIKAKEEKDGTDSNGSVGTGESKEGKVSLNNSFLCKDPLTHFSNITQANAFVRLLRKPFRGGGKMKRFLSGP